jgi:PilZ domain-containing protein
MATEQDESCGTEVSLAGWLAGVLALQAAARAGALDAGGLRRYRAARDDLLQVLLLGQLVMHEYGHPARQSVRMVTALQIDLCAPGIKIRASTLDISMGGFSVLLGMVPVEGGELTFSIRLPGTEPVKGTARVVAAVPRAGDMRVSFAFAGLALDGREQLNSFIFDTILNQLPHRLSSRSDAVAARGEVDSVSIVAQRVPVGERQAIGSL